MQRDIGQIGLFDAIYSARAIRKFRPDPVPDEMIAKILDAAVRAPFGGNLQQWLFVVVKDLEQRRRLAAIYKKAAEVIAAFYAARKRPEHVDEAVYRRMLASGSYLYEHMCFSEEHFSEFNEKLGNHWLMSDKNYRPPCIG